MTIYQDRPVDSRSIPDLFSAALAQFSRLLRTELKLARVEMTQKATTALSGIGFIVGGALFVGPGIVLLLTALAVFFIEHGMRPSLSYLIAAIVGLAIAGVLAMIGINRLKATDMMPDRAIRQINRDVAAVKQQV